MYRVEHPECTKYYKVDSVLRSDEEKERLMMSRKERRHT